MLKQAFLQAVERSIETAVPLSIITVAVIVLMYLGIRLLGRDLRSFIGFLKTGVRKEGTTAAGAVSLGGMVFAFIPVQFDAVGAVINSTLGQPAPTTAGDRLVFMGGFVVVALGNFLLLGILTAKRNSHERP